VVGFGFAFVGFDVGFSTFNYLKHVSIDGLKIGGSFVREIECIVVNLWQKTFIGQIRE
jgi:EAL domain-containing protein (putative c-di-GMP-specific phosphodiesterase class I)